MARFEDGNFDRTETVFGSASRIRDDHSIFVTSATTMVRLQYWTDGKRSVVSNSLDCLLRHIGAKLNVAYADYFADLLDLETIVFDRDAWRDQHLADAICISGDAKGEDVIFAGAAEVLPGCALLTGFPNTWDTSPPRKNMAMSFAARAGLGLSELKLLLGFEHVPIPFLGI